MAHPCRECDRWTRVRKVTHSLEPRLSAPLAAAPAVLAFETLHKVEECAGEAAAGLRRFTGQDSDPSSGREAPARPGAHRAR